jgi:hypothetical protein
MEGCSFSGEPALAVLPFLQQLTRVANQSHLSEGVLLWIAEDFLSTPARETFRAQHFDTWPAAVHWLLSTYASEQSLEVAVRKLQTTGQREDESVRQFGARLQMDAVALGSLLSSAEVKSLFAQGIRDPVRSLFIANQPTQELEDVAPLSVLVTRAELIETGSRAAMLPASRTGSRFPAVRPTVLAIPDHVEDGGHSAEQAAELLVLESRGAANASSKWICFVCYNIGHGWLECPYLQHISMAEKEEIVIRRRKYLDQVRAKSQTGRAASIWPSSVVNARSSAERQGATPPPSPKNERAPPHYQS